MEQSFRRGAALSAANRSQQRQPRGRNASAGLVLLLVLPYLALCFPKLYSRATPVLLGFPFFYWYQFLWVILTSASLGIVYRMLRTAEE